jgi:2-furoyl-CoA dehydrogenase large subunit
MPKKKLPSKMTGGKPKRTAAAKSNGTAHWVGKSVTPKELSRLVRGQGQFVDDWTFGGMVHMWLARSPYAHARINGIDTSAAERLPGVLAVITGKEVAAQVQPFIEIGPDVGQKIVDYPMAVDKVRYQGEPVAVIVAISKMAAEDAAALISVDYDVLEPVLDADTALADRNLIHEAAGTNRNWHGVFEYGDVDGAFRKAAHVVEIDRLHFHRFTSAPLENNVVIAQWEPRDNKIHYWCNNVFPAFAIQFLSPALQVPINSIRVQCHDVGGSFGIKITSYPQMALAALASKKLGGRPVKWVETRTEHMLSSAHGNERTFYDTRVALDREGRILGITSRHVDDCGAFPRYEPLGCVIWSQVLPGAYAFRNCRFDFNQVVTNKCPVGPNRGYSRMQHLWFLERVVDICAHQLGFDPVEIRKKNYIPANAFPYTTPNGCVYDSGDYVRMLEIAREKIGWGQWQRLISGMRREGRLVGIGIGTTLDSGTNNFGQSRIINPHAPFSGQSEAATIKLDIYGDIVVSVGSVPQGQSHETVVSQVVADVLGVTPDAVTVRPGFDSERNVHTGHTGTYASQFVVKGLSAVHGAAQKLKDEIRRLAAFSLKTKPDKIEFGMGQQGPEVWVRGDRAKSINYFGLANIVNVNTAILPDDLMDVTLNCRYVYRAPFSVPDIERKYGNLTLTYAAQLHIAVVEIDRDTYQPRILAYAAVDDCGKAVNPAIVEGQVYGATSHGIGAALMETCAYDPAGNMLTSTFSDYTPVTMVNIPRIAYGHMESPSPFTYNGAKGVGEGGAAPLHTLCAAIQDALAERGVVVLDSYNNAESVYQMLKRAEAGANASADWGVRVSKRLS